MIDHGQAACAARATLRARWALRALFIATVAVLALGPTAPAEAHTWLDQRFYEEQPRRPNAGKWKSRSSHARSAKSTRSAHTRSAKSRRSAHARPAKGRKHASSSKRRRIVMSESDLDHSARTAKRRARGYRVASLGNDIHEPSRPSRSLTGGGVSWVASAGCLAGSLKSVIHQVAANFGPVRVNSTCRSKRHNARVGGARHSHHLTGNAVDFRVRGNVSAAYAFLRSNSAVGGLKHYGGGLFHIDTGARRSW